MNGIYQSYDLVYRTLLGVPLLARDPQDHGVIEFERHDRETTVERTEPPPPRPPRRFATAVYRGVLDSISGPAVIAIMLPQAINGPPPLLTTRRTMHDLDTRCLEARCKPARKQC